ncbi:MAG TPA: response regulator transcription factor, partial [Pseudogracilibacillus sp.]|nr:response regulator transcription factor [Pseudogracilibacillus sp.]
SQILQAYFKKAGYDIIPVFRGDEAIPHIKKHKPDLVVLDVMLPGRSGWDILKNIRKEDLAPVIMLTALGEVPDRLKGLHEGADDYIPKPFVADEVVARAEAVLRRAGKLQQNLQRFGSLTINKVAHEVSLFNESIELTPRDTSVLFFLADHPNRTFTREELIEYVWGWDYEGSDRAVDLSIKRIRKALQNWPNTEGEIKTVRGMGYQFSV